MGLTDGVVLLPLVPGSRDEMWLDGAKAVAVHVLEAELVVRVHYIAEERAIRRRMSFLIGPTAQGVAGVRHLISFTRLGQIWHVFVENDGGQTVG
jgi:hypothetical protein